MRWSLEMVCPLEQSWLCQLCGLISAQYQYQYLVPSGDICPVPSRDSRVVYLVLTLRPPQPKYSILVYAVFFSETRGGSNKAGVLLSVKTEKDQM